MSSLIRMGGRQMVGFSKKLIKQSILIGYSFKVEGGGVPKSGPYLIL
jgi:hypothetical protein